jgi:hypothetical protein
MPKPLSDASAGSGNVKTPSSGAPVALTNASSEDLDHASTAI